MRLVVSDYHMSHLLYLAIIKRCSFGQKASKILGSFIPQIKEGPQLNLEEFLF